MILYYLLAWCTGLIYFALLVIVWVGLKRMPRSHYEKDDEKLPTVTIVVAARDEETGIGRLLDSLEAQDYPSDKFEVIVVDDRSSDSTGDLVRQRGDKGVGFQVLRIRDGESTGRAPKKYALGRGIERATSEIIVTTDADCWMSPKWLRALVSPFVDPEVHGATGVSRFVRPDDGPKPWWSDFESLEHLSYSVMAAGTIGAGHVFNAHGSNLAARRSAYDRVGGYESKDKIVSGDDVFLLQDIADHGGKVVFIDRREGYVFSQPVDTVSQWVNQRARWSSKSFYYPPFLRILVIGTAGFFASLALAIPLAFFGRLSPRLIVAMYAAKLAAETWTMKLGTKRFGEPLPVLTFLLTEILLAPAIVYAGARGQFFSFSWKGQTVGGRSRMTTGTRPARDKHS